MPGFLALQLLLSAVKLILSQVLNLIHCPSDLGFVLVWDLAHLAEHGLYLAFSGQKLKPELLQLLLITDGERFNFFFYLINIIKHHKSLI